MYSVTAHAAGDLEALIAELAGPDVRTPCRLVLDLPIEALPPWHLLDRLVLVGVAELVLPSPMLLTPRAPGPTLGFLRFLRDASAFGVPLEWRAGAIELDGGTLQLFSHLLPPGVADGAESEDVRRWRRDYAFGRLSWRQGPGFVIVKDTRPRTRPFRLILDDAASQRALLRLQAPTSLALLTDDEREQAGGLETEGVVLVLDGTGLSLAGRIRRWPISCVG
jgi:hypothetical protein